MRKLLLSQGRFRKEYELLCPFAGAFQSSARRSNIEGAPNGGWPYNARSLARDEVELLSIAFDASFTHMYAPGTRRHIQNALKAGASIEEVFEVLKICVAQGVQACNLGVPILEEELAARRSGFEAGRQTSL